MKQLSQTVLCQHALHKASPEWRKWVRGQRQEHNLQQHPNTSVFWCVMYLSYQCLTTLLDYRSGLPSMPALWLFSKNQVLKFIWNLTLPLLSKFSFYLLANQSFSNPRECPNVFWVHSVFSLFFSHSLMLKSSASKTQFKWCFFRETFLDVASWK